MYRDVIRFFNEWSGNATGAGPDDLFERFVLPTIIYIGDEVIVLQDRRDFGSLFARYMRERMAAGISDTHFRLNSVAKGGQGRISAWVTVSYAKGGQTTTDHTDIKYFFREVFGELKIEMIEFAPLDVPQMHPFYRACTRLQLA